MTASREVITPPPAHRRRQFAIGAAGDAVTMPAEAAMTGVRAEWVSARRVAVAAAKAGGEAALRHFRRADLAVEWKGDDSPVTRADREAEAACQAVVVAAFPADAWLGEETGASA